MLPPPTDYIPEQSVLFHSDDGPITGSIIVDRKERVSALPLWKAYDLPESLKGRKQTQTGGRLGFKK
jgi:hypothetical protein